MRSPMCDHCNMLLAIVFCLTHLARFCFQCDWKLHYASPDHSRFWLCNDCLSQTADVQCLEQGLCLCQTCFSNANVPSHNVFNHSLDYSFPPHLDLDTFSSSSSSSFIDVSRGFSCVPLPLDSSSSSEVFQNFGNKNSCDQQVQMLQPDYLEISKDSSCSSFDGYKSKDTSNLWMNSFEDYNSLPNYLDIPKDGSWLCNGYGTKETNNLWMNSFDDYVLVPNYFDIPKDSSWSGFNCYETKDLENIWMNNFDDDYVDISKDSSWSSFNGCASKDIENVWMNKFEDYFSAEELILTDQLINEITKYKSKTDIISFPSSDMSSVTNEDCSIEALANASCEETNNVGLFSNALVQLDCRPSQLILKDVDEMLPQEDRKPAYDPQARSEALKRYFAKKEKRKFGKEIRYESRKSTANTKRRLKGRFTKAGGEYDYDPRTSKSHLQRV